MAWANSDHTARLVIGASGSGISWNEMRASSWGDKEYPGRVDANRSPMTGSDASLTTLLLAAGIAVAFLGYLVVDGFRRWWRYQRLLRKSRRRPP